MSVDDIKDCAWAINVVGAVLLAIAVQYLRGIFVAKDRVEGIERQLSVAVDVQEFRYPRLGGVYRGVRAALARWNLSAASR